MCRPDRGFSERECKTLATTKKRPKKRAPTKAQQSARRAARAQVQAIVLFLIGVLLFLVSIISGNALWNRLHDALRGLFGVSSFFIGPVFIYIAVMSSFEKPADGIRLHGWMAALLLCIVSGTAQIFLAGDPDAGSFGELLKAFWANGVALRGGGVLSLLFGYPLMQLGSPGDKIAAVLMLVFLLMILTHSTVAGVLRGAKKPIDKAVAVSRSVADNFAAQQEAKQLARARRAQIDIPLDDEPPKRRRKEPAPGQTVPAAAQTSAAEALARKKPPAVDVEVPTASKDKLIAAAEKAAAAHEHEAKTQSAAPVQTPADDPPAETRPGEMPLAEFAPLGPKPAEEPAQEEAPQLDDLIDRAAKSGQEAAPAEAKQPANAAPAQAAPAAPPEEPPKPEYVLPPLTLLQEAKRRGGDDGTEELRQNAELLVNTLQSFGVQTRITDIARGPAVTRYELQPAAGVKISRITSLADDIALNLAAAGVRIEAPIPGKAAVGIEVPNSRVTPVTLREVLASPAFENAKSRIAVALGRDISGSPVVADIGKMPHLLIAGATGSGKSVCINTLLMSILFRARPDEVKLILVDPKVVELGVYNGLPHLAIPVVSDPKKAAGALNWAVAEMLKRYNLFAAVGARDLASYNKLVTAKREAAEKAASEGAAVEPVPAPMPQYVIVIDELADLMQAAPKEVEDAIQRLAQMARAAGMHLIIATQRPSVNVITGVIKANIPSRIAFAVSSAIDSRTILDEGGAEKLLGMGDMLFSPVGSNKPTRVQGCFVSDDEIERVLTFIKSAGEATYAEAVIAEIDKMIPAGKGNAGGASNAPAAEDDTDPMLDDAIECVVEAGIASTSLLQRKCKLGYARAARLIDELEARGIVGPFEGSKPRAVLITKERWLEMKLHRADAAGGDAEQMTLQ